MGDLALRYMTEYLKMAKTDGTKPNDKALIHKL